MQGAAPDGGSSYIATPCRVRALAVGCAARMGSDRHPALLGCGSLALILFPSTCTPAQEDDDECWKEEREAGREARKEQREWEKEQRKDAREARKEERKAERGKGGD